MSTVPDKKEGVCPLCGHSGNIFYKDLFYCCSNCFALFRPQKLFPTPNQEKERYEQHNNDVNDVGYQQFVSPITSRVIHDYPTNSVGLDFGSGTGPVASKVLMERGYTIYQYDPFFDCKPELLEEKYDYIICCEVIEHFHHPQKEFELLKKLLKPNGRLYCMTAIYHDQINFDKWYYKNDLTHVFIYQEKTLEWIKEAFKFSSISIENRLIVFQS